jgi:lysophospholipase L1-like esterase
MSGYKRGKPRGIKGNFALTVVTVIFACAVIVSAVLLFKRFPSVVTAGALSKTSSSATSSKSYTSSVTSSSSKTTSSSQPSASSQETTSSQETSSEPVNPDYFKDAVFVGDSLTEGLSLYGEMDDATIIGETGMSAYTSVAHKFSINGKSQYIADATAATKLDKIYLLLGSNDIAEGYSASKFTGYYGELISDLKSKCPDAKIYVQSVFPVTSKYELKKQLSGVYVTNEKIDQYNVALKAMCADDGATYLDVASVLKGPDGKLPLSASDDGMHLRKAYYDKWFAYLGANK